MFNRSAFQPHNNLGALPAVSKFSPIICAVALLVGDLHAQTPEKKDPKAVQSQANPAIQQVKDSKFDPMLVPHCYQGAGTLLCTVSSSLTMSQPLLGLKLSDDKTLLQISSIVSDRMMAGKQLSAQLGTLDLLGIETKSHDFANGKGFITTASAVSYAEQILKGDITKEINSGKMVGLSLESGSNTHAIAIMGIDSKTGEFIISNPARKSVTHESPESLAKRWPVMNVGTKFFELEAIITDSVTQVSSYDSVKPNGSILVSDYCLKFLATDVAPNPDRLDLSKVKRAYPDLRWVNAAGNWEPGRSPDKAIGFPLLAKLCISSPTQSKSFFAIIDDGNGKCQLIMIKGYKDGSSGQPLDGTFEIVTKKGTETITYTDFNRRCAAFTNTGKKTVAYIGYLPNPPRAPKQEKK